MFIVIFVCLAVAVGLISAFGGILKKIMEVISLLTKLCVGGFVSLLVAQLLHIEFGNIWWQLAYLFIGAVIVVALIAALASTFRLVGYSINFFINSFVLMIVSLILKQNVDIGFIAYAIVLLLFPRIMWFSDRFSTTSEYSHSSYSFWNDITTDFYTIKEVDWWENSEDSWRLLPVQIIIASLFYLIGCMTITSIHSFQSGWLTAVYVVLALAVNVLFDIFVTRNIEKRIG